MDPTMIEETFQAGPWEYHIRIDEHGSRFVYNEDGDKEFEVPSAMPVPHIKWAMVQMHKKYKKGMEDGAEHTRFRIRSELGLEGEMPSLLL